MHKIGRSGGVEDWLEVDTEGGLLLLCIQSEFSENASQILTTVVKEGRFNSRRLCSLAIEHRVAPQVYFTFMQLGLGQSLDAHSYRALELIAAASADRNLRMLAEAANIQAAIRRAGGATVLVKGPALEAYVYGQIGLRLYKDMDFVTRREDAGLVDGVLRGLGFEQGRLDEITGTVIAASREEIVLHTINTHEAFEYVKAGATLGCSFFVDVNFEVFWKGVGTYAGRHAIDTQVLLDNAFDFDGPAGIVTILGPEFQAIQLSAHLFSEAVLFPFSGRWDRDLNDMSLMRFADIYMLIKRIGIDWPLLAALGNTHNVGDALGYTMHYIERLFPGTVPPSFPALLESDGSRWIDRYIDHAAVERRWKLRFEDRLFDHFARAAELSRGSTSGPGRGELE